RRRASSTTSLTPLPVRAARTLMARSTPSSIVSVVRAFATSGLPQQLEGVGPLVAQEAGDAPEDAERLDGARGLHAAHVAGLVAELGEHLGDLALGFLAVAAEEHRRLRAAEVG